LSWVATAALFLGLAIGVVVLLAPGSATSPCGSVPACWSRPSGIIGVVHVDGAGALLLLQSLALVLAFVSPVGRARVVPLSASALGVLIVMASIGAGLAVGAVPRPWAPVQLLALAILVLLNFGLASRSAALAHGMTGAPPRPTSP
jgi:hypothetical protein